MTLQEFIDQKTQQLTDMEVTEVRLARVDRHVVPEDNKVSTVSLAAKRATLDAVAVLMLDDTVDTLHYGPMVESNWDQLQVTWRLTDDIDCVATPDPETEVADEPDPASEEDTDASDE